MKKLLLIAMFLLGTATNTFGMDLDPKNRTLSQAFNQCIDDIFALRKEKEMLNKKGVIESFNDYCENFVFTMIKMFGNIFESSASDERFSFRFCERNFI